MFGNSKDEVSVESYRSIFDTFTEVVSRFPQLVANSVEEGRYVINGSASRKALKARLSNEIGKQYTEWQQSGGEERRRAYRGHNLWMGRLDDIEVDEKKNLEVSNTGEKEEDEEEKQPSSGEVKGEKLPKLICLLPGS